MARLFLTRRLARDEKGAFAIETALVLPLLASLALGVFEVGNVVSRQQELQSAANEGTMIILSASRGAGVSSNDLKTIIAKSVGLDAEQLTITVQYRCDDADEKITDPTECATDKPVFEYVDLKMTDSYTPIWTKYGFGKPMNYNVERSVQVS